MKNLYKIMFYIILMTSTMIAISSMSWLTAWMGLEINLLALMPLMKGYKNMYSTEATIKYFIVQAMASSMLLFSIIIFSNYLEFNSTLSLFTSMFIGSSLLLKLGAAPFHFWLPEVISGLDWKMIFIILTWQKIAPMMLLAYSMNSPMFISISAISSSLISGLQGMNQTCLRKIMAYSSINHMSWMISALMVSFSVWFYYFIIYSIINLNIMFIFNSYKIFFIKQLSKLFLFNKKVKFFFMLNFLSLGGLPPFLGFFPKWLTINILIKNKYFILSLFLVIFTLISLYFYLRITFTTFSVSSQKSSMKTFNKINFIHFFLNLTSLLGLSICLIITNYF